MRRKPNETLFSDNVTVNSTTKVKTEIIVIIKITIKIDHIRGFASYFQ